MIQTLFYSPGQTATVFVETLNSNGVRADAVVDGYLDGSNNGDIDGYHHPMIERLVFPDLSLANDYPAYMVKLDTGLYYYQFILPTGATSVGSYLVDISYTNPTTLYTNTVIYQLIVSAPYGNYSITTQ